tara:strand:+ start:442 stop:663 length:222 start_codon:yes stop_codon:yes gene_type:complete
MGRVTLMNDITEYLYIYKSKGLENLNYCELKEFRKFALWKNEQDLAEMILQLRSFLVKTKQVTDQKMEAFAYL